MLRQEIQTRQTYTPVDKAGGERSLLEQLSRNGDDVERLLRSEFADRGPQHVNARARGIIPDRLSLTHSSEHIDRLGISTRH